MASSKRRGGRVTNVPITAIGSGANVLDLFPLPVPLFIFFQVIFIMIKHWYLSLLFLLFFFDFQTLAFFVLIGVPTILYGYVYTYNRQASPTSVARAAVYLVRSRLRWRRACMAAGLSDGPRVPRLISPKRPPKISNSRGSSITYTLNLARVGLTVRQLEESRDTLAAVLHAQRTRINRLTPGIAKLTIEWDKKAIRSPQAFHQQSDLPMVELDQNVFLQLDTSMLVVGKSGAGKSNLTWHVLNGLNQSQIPYRLYVVDPKKVELADLVESPNIRRYADSSAETENVILEFFEDMMTTFARMKQDGIRKIEISKDNPLKILIVDELLMCGKQIRGDITETALGQVLTAGRAAGYIVIANSQLGQVDVLGRVRDLFPQRICMAVNSADLTSAVLGPRSEERGARCTEITESGVGYIYTDYSGAFQRFHPPFIADTKLVAEGRVFNPYATSKTTHKYAWRR